MDSTFSMPCLYTIRLGACQRSWLASIRTLRLEALHIQAEAESTGIIDTLTAAAGQLDETIPKL